MALDAELKDDRLVVAAPSQAGGERYGLVEAVLGKLAA